MDVVRISRRAMLFQPIRGQVEIGEVFPLGCLEKLLAHTTPPVIFMITAMMSVPKPVNVTTIPIKK